MDLDRHQSEPRNPYGLPRLPRERRDLLKTYAIAAGVVGSTFLVSYLIREARDLQRLIG